MTMPSTVTAEQIIQLERAALDRWLFSPVDEQLWFDMYKHGRLPTQDSRPAAAE